MIFKNYRIKTSAYIIVLQFIIGFVGISFGFIEAINVENDKWSNLIYPGLKISNIDLSGQTKESAKNILEKEYINKLKDKNLSIVIDNNTFRFDANKYILNSDLDKKIDEAFSFGKSSGSFTKFTLIKEGSNKNYNITFSLNENYIDTFISSMQKEIYSTPSNALFKKLSTGNNVIVPDVDGKAIDKDSLVMLIKTNLFNKNSSSSIKAPIKHLSAKITKDTLLSINSLISQYETSLKNSPENRTKNVELASNYINGTFIAPGETFSFNDTVGERTKERGFQDAKIIVGNKYESGIGGGICQVSTTLYNAILNSGVSSIKKTSHSLPVSYASLGMDATVVWGSIDFQFTNTLKYPIYIESYIENNALHVDIFSHSDTANNYALGNVIASETPPAYK